MYLRNDIDITIFLSRVIKCQEAVIFQSVTGDSFNLNSILSQVVFQNFVSESDNWKKGTIHCLREEDYLLLKEYLR